MDVVVHASGLEKRYGQVVALDGLDLDVPRGTVLGLLGPNGAGKTTTVRILATLLVPDAGTARVVGVDVTEDPKRVRRSIGLSGQYAAVDEHLTGFENLDMVGRLYRLDRATSRSRARELLERFDLVDSADRPVKTYSGGMRRRLDLAGALVASPPVLMLDEPTTGLDPRSRVDLWTAIEELVEGGTTVLLTTQYMEEAERLADDILVIDHGRAIARGTPDQLKRQVGGERLELVVDGVGQLPAAREVVRAFTVGEVLVDEDTRTVTAPVRDGAGMLAEVLRELDASGVTVRDVGIRRPTLDDVFLSLTGHVAVHEDGGSPTRETAQIEEVVR